MGADCRRTHSPMSALWKREIAEGRLDSCHRSTSREAARSRSAGPRSSPLPSLRDTRPMTQDVPDPRFSLANERTFLAWIRTALGMLAAAAAVLAIDVPWPDLVVGGVAILLAVTAAASAIVGWRRWQKVESAIQAGDPAPALRGHAILPGAVVAVAGIIVLLAVI